MRCMLPCQGARLLFFQGSAIILICTLTEAFWALCGLSKLRICGFLHQLSGLKSACLLLPAFLGTRMTFMTGLLTTPSFAIQGRGGGRFLDTGTKMRFQ